MFLCSIINTLEIFHHTFVIDQLLELPHKKTYIQSKDFSLILGCLIDDSMEYDSM